MPTTKSYLLAFALCLLSLASRAEMPENNLTAIGQGVASPSTTSLVNIGRGLVGVENPAGLMYISGFRLSAEVAKDTVSGSGFEGSYSSKNYGLALGTYNPGCDGCIAHNAAILGAAFKYANVGLRYQLVDKIPTYGLGLIFNPTGKHRFGAHVEDENPDVKDSSIMKTGFGYSYVDNEDTINIDVTQSKTSTTSTSMNSIGYKKKVSYLEVSMTYEMGSAGGTDKFWMGAGFKGRTFNLAIYSQYASQLLLVLSAFF
jgi:hypothetical protein